MGAWTQMRTPRHVHVAAMHVCLSQKTGAGKLQVPVANPRTGRRDRQQILAYLDKADVENMRNNIATAEMGPEC